MKIHIEKTLRKLFFVFFIFLQSCNSIPKINTNCNKIDQEVSKRYSLFKDLNQIEIQKRSGVNVPSYSKLKDLSVFSQIVNSVKKAKLNSKLIAVDLRNYNSVNLGNIVISNIKSDLSLNLFLKTSKYSQGFFALINFGQDKITIMSPDKPKHFDKVQINRSDLQDVELVFNLKNSNEILSNMKFSKNQKVSLLARNIKNPFRLDLRESSNGQFNLGQKWIMSVYDISKSEIKGGKKTSGYYLYVNNDNVKNIKLHKFNKSKVACYSNSGGFKFEENIDDSLL